MDDLTDLDGIGAKTAEKLRSDGINSPRELANRLRESPVSFKREYGTRIRRAARDAAVQRGGFTDPYTGAEITEENQQAFELLATKRVKDLDSVGTEASNPSVDPETEVRDVVPEVEQGTFFRDVGGDPNLMRFAADTAQNFGTDTLDSGELQDLNEASQLASEEVTLRETSSVGNKTTTRGDIAAGGFIQALSAHQDRSPKARRVDNRREATRTTDVSQWRSAPDNFDYPGVDTPKGAGEFFPEERSFRKRGGFGSGTRRNRDREQLEETAEQIQRLNEEQSERLFGDPSVPEFDLEAAFKR